MKSAAYPPVARMTVPISVYYLSAWLENMDKRAYMLALVLVVYTSDLFTILNDFLDVRLLEDLDSVRLVLCDILKLLISKDFSQMNQNRREQERPETDLLHESIGNGHTRELSPTSMSSLFTMSPKSRYFTEIKVESLNQPVNGISRFISEDLDEVVSG